MEISITTTVAFEINTCISCGVKFGVPVELDKKLRENHKKFCCPNGHEQWYTGESQAEKLRRELKRKEQELADQVREKLLTQNQLLIAEKKLKRVSKGVCPCCNRSFANLQSHMKTKHPEVVKK